MFPPSVRSAEHIAQFHRPVKLNLYNLIYPPSLPPYQPTCWQLQCLLTVSVIDQSLCWCISELVLQEAIDAFLLLLLLLNGTTTLAFSAAYFGLHHECVAPSLQLILVLFLSMFEGHAFREVCSGCHRWFLRLHVMVMLKPVVEAVVCILYKRHFISKIKYIFRESN